MHIICFTTIRNSFILVPRGSVSSADSFEEKAITNPSLVMKMDPRLIEHHINTIWRQTEVARFLAECEKTGRINLNILPEIVPLFEEGKQQNLIDNNVTCI